MKSKPKPLGYYNQKSTKLKIKTPGTSEGSEVVVLKVPKKELDKDYPDKTKAKEWI